jgi:hypothetical protein
MVANTAAAASTVRCCAASPAPGMYALGAAACLTQMKSHLCSHAAWSVGKRMMGRAVGLPTSPQHKQHASTVVCLLPLHTCSRGSVRGSQPPQQPMRSKFLEQQQPDAGMGNGPTPGSHTLIHTLCFNLGPAELAGAAVLMHMQMRLAGNPHARLHPSAVMPPHFLTVTGGCSHYSVTAVSPGTPSDEDSRHCSSSHRLGRLLGRGRQGSAHLCNRAQHTEVGEGGQGGKPTSHNL